MSTIIENTIDRNLTHAEVIKDVFAGENGQVVLSNDVVAQIGVTPKMRMKILKVDGLLVLMNAALYAISKARAGMEGEAERLGLHTEEDVYEFLNDLRHGSSDVN